MHVLHAIQWGVVAWNLDVKLSTIAHCWAKSQCWAETQSIEGPLPVDILNPETLDPDSTDAIKDIQANIQVLQ